MNKDTMLRAIKINQAMLLLNDEKGRKEGKSNYKLLFSNLCGRRSQTRQYKEPGLKQNSRKYLG